MEASRTTPIEPARNLPMQAASDEEGDLGQTIERVRRIVVQYRRLIVLTACSVMIATMGAVHVLPNRYTSEATLVVVQQQVPERYVTPNSTTPVAAELQAMKQEVLSRTRLQDIVKRFGLYPKETINSAPEKVLELVQKDIEITPLSETPTPAGKDFAAFKISFTAKDPVVAQQVTSTLTSLFIKENLKTREDQATNTTSFLHEQLQAAKTKLEDQDQRLRDFKMQHLGELPEQQQGNLGILTSLQTQLQNTMATMSRAMEQRVYLETLLSGYQSMRSRNIPIERGAELSAAASPADAAQIVLVRLRAEQAALAVHYTPTHPDVAAKAKEIAAAQVVLDRLLAEAPKPLTPKSGKPESEALAVPNAADQPAIAQVKSQLEANRLEIANLTKEETRLKASLDQYQERLNQTPVREQQLTGLLRDYELQKQNYTDLLNKVLQSQLATNLEKDQGGRQFRLVDPPSLPTLPSSPNRRKINTGGMAGGIALGLALALAMGMRDRSFHSEQELTQRFGLPLVVSVPVLLTSSERRSRTWQAALDWSVGSVLILAVVAAELYMYRLSAIG